MYVLEIIKNIYAILDAAQKRKMLFIQFFFMFSALIQIVGVASIAPFIGLVSNPEGIESSVVLSAVYRWGGFTDHKVFIIAFALMSIGLIFISNGVNALTLWVQIKFSIFLGTTLQARLFDKFIRREYLYHKTHNYNRPIAVISSDAPRFIYMVLQPYLLMCSQLFVAVIIMVGLLLLDPIIAIGSAILISCAYLSTYLIIKRRLKYHGNILMEHNRAVQALLSETFIGIKDIKLSGLESAYNKKYLSIIQNGFSSSAFITLSGDLPRFAVETISFSAILLFAILLIVGESAGRDVVSILSVYALAGYKLLPTMQQMYKSISNISANGDVVRELKNELEAVTPEEETTHSIHTEPVASIQIRDVTYRYPGADIVALNNVNLNFELGYLNTIAGPSGSGKSTLADIILGLLYPTDGKICVDLNEVNAATIGAYQRGIGYVPQQIFILDDTVKANVAFGVIDSEIDDERVSHALKMANAMEFVELLPFGVNTGLGQDGKLLSGGQRQRIGIARALYRDVKVLILDEPTSALDIESEHNFMNQLSKLKNDVLIIVISHRPAAIKLSDKITVISNGEVVADGNYDKIYLESAYFRSMIEKGLMSH